MKATEITYPVYADAHGEHWRPADHTDRDWLRCVETDRGTRRLGSVVEEFGPLTPVIDLQCALYGLDEGCDWEVDIGRSGELGAVLNLARQHIAEAHP